MPANPFEMTPERFIGQQRTKRIELTRQRHFIVGIMDTVVTRAANVDALSQCLLRILSPETHAAMELFRDQVMKRQR